MGVLEQTIEMKRQGIPDDEIVTLLRQQGFSPREIKDAIDQSQIKEAVYNPAPESEVPSPETSTEGLYMPQTKEIPGGAYPESYPESQGYSYPTESGYEYPESNTETIIEVAEQVFSEKMKKTHKRLSELNEFRTLSQSKIEDFSERIKRIESTMDKLQAAILEKIGSYGKTLEGIKKEMSMMQDSFGKIINPVIERAEKKFIDKKISKKK